MFTRFFDILFSLFGVLILSPFFIVISILIKLDSNGHVFYSQIRVGKDNVDFKLMKFRTMFAESDKKGLLTIGTNDSRITKVGSFLRKYKLDEMPQLLNVILGDMSFVGPRPEVRKYVNLYNEDQLMILSRKPGVTDYASIHFINENEILGKSDDPERSYVEIVMPQKIELNKKFIENPSVVEYFKIIALTFLKILQQTK